MPGENYIARVIFIMICPLFLLVKLAADRHADKQTDQQETNDHAEGRRDRMESGREVVEGEQIVEGEEEKIRDWRKMRERREPKMK